VRKLLEWIVYVGFRLAWSTLAVLPLARARAGLEGVAVLVERLDRRHRRVIDDNLGIAFPQWSRQRVAEVRRAAFANWGRIAAELTHESEFVERADALLLDEVKQVADELLGRGRGLLVLTAHLGNFELLARVWGRRTGGRLASFHRPLNNPLVDRYLLDGRAASGLRTLPRRRGIIVREALRVLARGEIFVVPLDQNQPHGRGVFVDMFGKPACTSTMLARLALAAQAPVLPVFAAWKGEGLVAVLGEVIEVPRGAASLRGQQRQALLLELTSRYTAAIEGAVRAFPQQWNWAHRRWKTRPESEQKALGRK